jgi:hypothetical protein
MPALKHVKKDEIQYRKAKNAEKKEMNVGMNGGEKAMNGGGSGAKSSNNGSKMRAGMKMSNTGGTKNSNAKNTTTSTTTNAPTTTTNAPSSSSTSTKTHTTSRGTEKGTAAVAATGTASGKPGSSTSKASKSSGNSSSVSSASSTTSSSTTTTTTTKAPTPARIAKSDISTTKAPAAATTTKAPTHITSEPHPSGHGSSHSSSHKSVSLEDRVGLSQDDPEDPSGMPTTMSPQDIAKWWNPPKKSVNEINEIFPADSEPTAAEYNVEKNQAEYIEAESDADTQFSADHTNSGDNPPASVLPSMPITEQQGFLMSNRNYRKLSEEVEQLKSEIQLLAKEDVAKEDKDIVRVDDAVGDDAALDDAPGNNNNSNNLSPGNSDISSELGLTPPSASGGGKTQVRSGKTGRSQAEENMKIDTLNNGLRPGERLRHHENADNHENASGSTNEESTNQTLEAQSNNSSNNNSSNNSSTSGSSSGSSSESNSSSSNDDDDDHTESTTVEIEEDLCPDIFTHDSLLFFIQVFELFRRAFWAILRLENEHLTNSSKFRAFCFVPPLMVND